MSKIAFLGLGNMGTPMTTRLLNAGHDVIVWNRSAPTKSAVGSGGSQRRRVVDHARVRRLV